MKITKLQVINYVGGTVVGIGPIWVIDTCLISLELTIYELCVKFSILLEMLNIFLIFSEVYPIQKHVQTKQKVSREPKQEQQCTYLY